MVTGEKINGNLSARPLEKEPKRIGTASKVKDVRTYG
jgi:hypothetical protein